MNAEDREIISDMKGALENTRWLLSRLEGEAIEADHLRVLANQYLDAKEASEARAEALEEECRRLKKGISVAGKQSEASKETRK